MNSTATAEIMLGTGQPALEHKVRISVSLMVVLSRRPVDAGWEDGMMSGHFSGTKSRSSLWGTSDASLGFRAGLKQQGV